VVVVIILVTRQGLEDAVSGFLLNTGN